MNKEAKIQQFRSEDLMIHKLQKWGIGLKANLIGHISQLSDPLNTFRSEK